MIKLEKYLDYLFCEYEQTNEIIELKEELLGFLLDKIEDLMNEGIEPNLAFDQAIQSLGTIEEMLNDFRNDQLKLLNGYENHQTQTVGNKNFAIKLCIGIGFCIVAVIGMVCLEELYPSLNEAYSLLWMFVFGGLGALIIVYAALTKNDPLITSRQSSSNKHHIYNKISDQIIFGGCMLFFFIRGFTVGFGQAWMIWPIYIGLVIVNSGIKKLFQ